MTSQAARRYVERRGAPGPEVPLLAVLLVAALAGTPRPCPAGQDADSARVTPRQPRDVASLLEKAAQGGTVNVIVGLKLPGGYTPEPSLRDGGAVERQRAEIRAARRALLASLHGLGATEYRSWERLPLVALKVNEAAIRVLAESAHVTTIQQDATSTVQ